MKASLKLLTLTIVTLFLSNGLLKAQMNILYNSEMIPQSVYVNPAYQNKCKLYLGLPGMSNTAIHFNNTGFAYKHLFKQRNDTSFVDLNNIRNTLSKVNYLGTNVRLDLLAMGFKSGNSYISMNISTVLDQRIGYPKGFVDMLYGNWDFSAGGDNYGQPIDLDFSGLQANLLSYTELGFGVSTEITRKLTTGIRFKFLLGHAYMNTSKSDLVISTNPDNLNITARTDYEFIVTPGAVDYVENQDGTLNWDSIEAKEYDDTNTLLQDVVFGNKGIAFDLGATYELTDEIFLSASIIDLGFIGWNASPYTLNAKGSYTFKGLDLSPKPGEYEFAEISEMTEMLTDSIKNSFELGVTEGKVTKMLPTKVFLGGKYKIIDKVNAGLVTRFDFYDKKIHPSATISVNTSPINLVSFSLAYTMMHRSYDNLGFALGLKPGPFHFYMMMEKVPTRYVSIYNDGEKITPALGIPYNMRFFNIRLGFNLVFGCKEKIDMPSIIFSEY